MKVKVILNREGRVARATAGAPPMPLSGHPSGWLVAGPGQRLVELDVPRELVPGPESEPAEVEQFFAELTERVRREGP